VNATEKQRNLIVMLQLLGKVKQHIEQTALTGRFAEEEAARKSPELQEVTPSRPSTAAGTPPLRTKRE
jgi:hypothetical protein